MRVRPLGLAARRSFSSFLHLARRIQGALRVGQTPLRNVVFVKGSLVGPLSPASPVVVGVVSLVRFRAT